MRSNHLNKEEKEILDSYEKGEWKPVKSSRSGLRRYVEGAKATLRKDQRINIRISQADLRGIQSKAVREGMPYQTLIASVLHKYVSGGLVSA